MKGYDFIKPTPRKKITPKKRLEIFLREKGICHLCGLQIRPGEEWDISHPETGLWAGGSDDPAILKPAHREKCHRSHTRDEAAQRAKEATVRSKFLGSMQRKGPPMPGSRRSKWKRKVGGGWVKREKD